MSKQIIVPPRPQQSNPPASAADWIDRPEGQPAIAEAPAESQVRLTFDISESLHRRIKIACARKGIKRMAVELRRILDEQFPPEAA